MKSLIFVSSNFFLRLVVFEISMVCHATRLCVRSLLACVLVVRATLPDVRQALQDSSATRPSIHDWISSTLVYPVVHVDSVDRPGLPPVSNALFHPAVPSLPHPIHATDQALISAVSLHVKASAANSVVVHSSANSIAHQAGRVGGGGGPPSTSAHHHHPCQPGHHRPPRCESSTRSNGSVVYCSSGVFPRSRRSVRTLVLCHWPEDPVDLSKVTNFPLLWRLKMIDSNVTEVMDFPYHDHLEELVLSGLRLTWLGPEVFTGLRRLRFVDLSSNQLSALDSGVLLRPPGLERVRLAGNPWRCTLALSWLSETPVRRMLEDEDAMQCGAALYPRRPVMTVIGLLKRVREECPASDMCSCELTRLVRDARDVSRDADVADLVPIITVNCSHRGLGAMPELLPANTTTLLLRGNRISSVRPLVDKHASVLDVYLDDNSVESIDDLEGSPWLTNFRVLSLRANRLQQLPTYALENALERNDHAVRVYLGHNPWRCDCDFMPLFQELLAKYKSLIADWDDIRCEAIEGDENSLKKIHSLSRSAVCMEEAEPKVSALDMLNAFLGIALLVVLSKLAFDFWQYRRYGKLPWIATKLP